MEGEAPAEPFRRTCRNLGPRATQSGRSPPGPVVAVLDQIPGATTGYHGAVCDDQENRHPLCLGPTFFGQLGSRPAPGRKALLTKTGWHPPRLSRSFALHAQHRSSRLRVLKWAQDGTLHAALR